MFLNLLLTQICLLLILPFQCLNTSHIAKQHTIPFKLVHNKVLVPVNIGNSRTFDLILDSAFGFDGIILFNKDLTDSINLGRRIMVKIPGAGESPPSEAIMSDSMTFNSGTCEFNNQPVIILQNEIFEGSAGDGVIGYSYFGHYKVEVDYDNKIIILRDPNEIIDDTGWETIPLTFNEKNYPYLNIYIAIENEEPILLNVYIDYASSLSIELTVKPDMKFKLPEKFEADYRGFGLSGDVEGKTARISTFIIGKYEFNNVTATFFEGSGRSKDITTDGVISNDALRRFNLIFDFQNKKLLIKPNSYFNEPFEVIR